MRCRFGRLSYGDPDAISNAVGDAEFRSRSHEAVIRVYDETGDVIETHDQAGEFKDWYRVLVAVPTDSAS
jgi:hypothetical protein